MGGGGKSYSPPTPPPPPPPPDLPAEGDSEEVRKARDNEQKALMAAKGRASTILTGPLGDSGTAEVRKHDLLGQ